MLNKMGMLSFNTSHEYAVALCAAFVGVCLLVSALFHLVLRPLLWQRDLERRLKGQKVKMQRVQILKAMAEADKSLFLHFIERLIGWGKIENLRRTLLQADVFWTTTKFLGICALAGSLGLLYGVIRNNLILGLILAGILGSVPYWVIQFKKNRKAKLFELQLPEGMELLARSMRAGHTLPSAIELAGREIPSPLGAEMKVVYEEQRLGLGLQAALIRMGERVFSQDLQYFITAVTLQTETGGNLAEVMENIGYLIRERLKLKGKIQALSAEGRFSAIILTLLPVGLFLVLSVVNPRYMAVFYDASIGFKMIGGCLVGIALGFIWMQHIIKIKV